MPRYLTPAELARHEGPPIKGSRFVATVAPAAGEAEAQAFVERVRAELDGARHVCFAWRLGPRGERTRASDAGEPSGSAGRPILAQLEGHEVSDAVLAVARWFGGVKLGVGGLMRAYGGAAGHCLDRARLVAVEVTRTLAVEHPWECSSAVQAVLAAQELEPEGAEYGERVRFRLRVPEDRAAAVAAELTERTGGRARVSEWSREE